MKVVVLIGRICFSLIFIMSSFGHFSSKTIGYAASQGVPMASFLVPASGIIALVGGLSIIFGYRAKLGAWLIVIFLVPVTIVFHNFWAVHDPMMRQMQMINFLKNLSMLGGAMVIACIGAGPVSIDAAREKIGKRPVAPVKA